MNLVSYESAAAVPSEISMNTGWVMSSNLPFNASVQGGQLYQCADGSLAVRPKAPAEVVGERILKPILDATYDLSTRTFKALKSGLNVLDALLSRVSNFLPSAEAHTVTDDNAISVIESENDETDGFYNGEPCPAWKRLNKAFEKAHHRSITDSEEASPHQKRPEIAPKESEESVENNPKIEVEENNPFLTDEQARAYINDHLPPGEPPIQMFERHCLATLSIDQIREIKTLTLDQKEAFKEAYDQLQHLAQEDALVPCCRKLMELFEVLSATIDSYSLDTLRPLPTFLKTLLRRSSTGYTLLDLDHLVTKINDISRAMIPGLQKTNEKEALLHWFDVLLESAEKNHNLLFSTFETAANLLQSKMGEEIIERNQKKELRRMVAIWKKNNALTQEEQLIADKLLVMTTGSRIWLFELFFSYLECIPDDIKKFDASVQEILSAFFLSKTFQELGAVIIIGAIVWRFRNRNRQPPEN